jgi:hypothetical protein
MSTKPKVWPVRCAPAEPICPIKVESKPMGSARLLFKLTQT